MTRAELSGKEAPVWFEVDVAGSSFNRGDTATAKV
jgi:hypothetical protein